MTPYCRCYVQGVIATKQVVADRDRVVKGASSGEEYKYDGLS